MTNIPEGDASEQQGPGHDVAGQGVPGQGPTPPSPLTSPPEAQLLDSPRRRLGGKSIWAWLNLLSNLAIPVIVATIGLGLWQAHQQQQSAQLSTQNRDNQDQRLALDQQRAAILQTYIDNMQDLLLNHNLSKSEPGDEIRQVATEQTLTTLRRLDASRNRLVLRFLQDAHLIGIQDAVINLSNTDLSNDYLSGADLSGIDLAGATLTGAYLNGADLSDTNLSNAYLFDANLTRAHLSNAYLFDANLTRAHLNDAYLSGATFTGAILDDTIVNGATLTAARLNGADLSGADLSGADLSGADLSYADLRDADLRDADLSYADLSTSANLTPPQLDKVYSCTNATLSTGLTCRHSVTITLKYWYTENNEETSVILKLISQFDRQNPNIKIKAINKPFFQAQTAFVAGAQAGTAPDVFRSDLGWVTQFASQRYLLNIGSYISQGSLSDYLSAPLRYDYYNGQLYGLPQVTDFLALLYNKAELAKAGINSPPATMTDLERDTEKVVQDKAATYGFETNGTSYYVLPFLYAFGGGMFDQHNNILVNSNGSVNGLRFLLKLQNTDKVMPTNVNFSDGGGNMVNDFMSGKAAMIFDDAPDVLQIRTGRAFTGKYSNLGVASIPVGPAGQTGSPVGGQSYVISAGTAHPFEAYKFISFMSSTASQVAIAKANHTLPTRQSAQDEVSSYPGIKDFLSIKNTVVARPAIPQGVHLFDAFDPNIEAALDGGESPNDALNAVAEAWRQLRAGS